jgi:hypothetical protein
LFRNSGFYKLTAEHAENAEQQNTLAVSGAQPAYMFLAFLGALSDLSGDFF